jgi:hypothetical protein
MGGFKLKQELMTSPVIIEKSKNKTKLPEGKPVVKRPVVCSKQK